MDLPQLTTQHHNVACSLVMWVESLGCVRCFPGSATNKPGLLSNAQVADHSPENTFPNALGTGRCPSPGSPSYEDAGGQLFWKNHTWGAGPLHPSPLALWDGAAPGDGGEAKSKSTLSCVSLRSDGSSPCEQPSLHSVHLISAAQGTSGSERKGLPEWQGEYVGQRKAATSFLKCLARFLLEKPLQWRPSSLHDPLGHSTTCWQRDVSRVGDGTQGEKTTLAVCFS